MAVDSYGDRGQPQFSAQGGMDAGADETTLADYSSVVGTRRVGTTAQRLALAGAALFDGLLWGDTTNGNEYRYTSAGWVVIYENGTWVAVTLGSGWSNETSNPVMARRKSGIVFTRGRASTTGATANAFTYPTGMLPDWTGGTAFPADANGAATARIFLLGSGVAQISGTYTNVGFAAISPFPAA